MVVVSFGDLMASRPFLMVSPSFDIYRRPYSELLNPGVGSATIALREESFVQLHVLHSVLL